MLPGKGGGEGVAESVGGGAAGIVGDSCVAGGNAGDWITDPGGGIVVGPNRGGVALAGKKIRSPVGSIRGTRQRVQAVPDRPQASSAKMRRMVVFCDPAMANFAGC